MSVENEFDRVRMALRAEEEQLARELERIDAEARATVEAAAEHARAELVTQADRIREAIAQQRVDVWAEYRERVDATADDPQGQDAAGSGAAPVEGDAEAGAGAPDVTAEDRTEAPHTDAPTDQPGAERSEEQLDDHGRDHEDRDPAADGPVVEGPADDVHAPGVEHVTGSDDGPQRTVGDTERGD